MKITKKHVLIASFLPLAVILSFYIIFWNKAKPAESGSFSMDTYISYQIWGSGNKEEIENSDTLVAMLDRQFSMYGDGELAQLNENSGGTVDTTPDLFDVTEKACGLSSKYGDTVDITSGSLTKLWGVSTETPYLPAKEEALEAVSHIDYTKLELNGTENSITLPRGTLLDLGSVAKGYACDRLKSLYDKNGDVSCAIVSMGSSSLLYGTKPDKSPFIVEIKNPDGGEPLGIIRTGETFLSTSGGYERFFEVGGVKYSHIFDLKTGFPAESSITSVTVLCDSGIKSDFLSTLIFIDDIGGLKKHMNAGDYKIIAADKDKKIYASSAIDFTLNKESGYTMGKLE